MEESNTFQGKKRLYTLLFLVLINIAVFGQTITFDFVSYDDQTYLIFNPEIEKGLNWETFKWGLTSSYFVSWHPVTWWTFLLDSSIYGLDASGFHASNVIYHILATILLFYALLRMTSRYWESLIVAVLFAIHPQHVQSVAWVSERKDVLSAIFMSLTLIAYYRYTLEHKWRWYGMTALMFLLGLMSKSMLVTLPCAMFLLDYWPLNRLSDKKAVIRATLEKIPLLALSMATSVLTFVLQNDGGATTSVELFGFFGRFINVLNSYTVYLYRTVWPVNLSFFYSLDVHNIPVMKGVFSGIVLLAITIVTWIYRKKAPQLIVGWLWYLGILVPVIGFVQVGQQANADRYTYIPLIGIFFAVVYTIHPWLFAKEQRKRITKMAYVIITFTLMLMSFKETSFWKDSALLAGRAYDINKGNFVACHMLGNIHLEYKSYGHAERFYKRCLEKQPKAYLVRLSLAESLNGQGKTEEAHEQLQLCYKTNSEDGNVRFQLANMAVRMGQMEEARYWYEQAIQSSEPKAEFFDKYATFMARKGELENAIKAYDMAIDLDAEYLPAYHNKASALFQYDKITEAMDLVTVILEIDPKYEPTLTLKDAIEAQIVP